MRPSAIIAPLALCVLLSACAEAAAPSDPGVCWRRDGAGGGQPRFVAISRGVGSLDDCAAQLEALHLQSHRTADGAFQGYFIFVDDRQIASSTGLATFRYPIFQPSQRREIDADLKALIKDRNGAVPSAGDIAVERK